MSGRVDAFDDKVPVVEPDLLHVLARRNTVGEKLDAVPCRDLKDAPEGAGEYVAACEPSAKPNPA